MKKMEIWTFIFCQYKALLFLAIASSQLNVFGEKQVLGENDRRDRGPFEIE